MMEIVAVNDSLKLTIGVTKLTIKVILPNRVRQQGVGNIYNVTNPSQRVNGTYVHIYRVLEKMALFLLKKKRLLNQTRE